MDSTEMLVTTEQLQAMPDDGVERELIRGQLRERPVTRRNRRHSRTTTNLARVLGNWLLEQAEPRGEVLTGEAGVRIRRDPDTTVGIDVAYISAELASASPDDASLIDGPPVLAVEILSPSDKHEEIVEKIEEYLDCGVAVVWVVDPDLRTVTVHRRGARVVESLRDSTPVSERPAYVRGAEPELFNIHQELSGEPPLPGFRVAVAEIFRSVAG